MAVRPPFRTVTRVCLAGRRDTVLSRGVPTFGSHPAVVDGRKSRRAMRIGRRATRTARRAMRIARRAMRIARRATRTARRAMRIA
jgi:hypothetical protein